MKEVKELLGLGKEYKIMIIEEEKIKGKTNKLIYVESIKEKEKCPKCRKYTKSIHDKLKPSKIKYLKSAEYQTYIIIRKRRFICHKCNIKFTEILDLNNKNKNISNKLEQKVLKDLLEYNLSLKYIAKENNLSDNAVRSILKNAMNGYPNHLRLLPSRKKEDLMQYFTKVENRSSVQYVVSDMYEPYLIVTRTMFPKAKYVVDRFHYIRYIMNALDKIRIRLQKEYGYNSKEYRLLKNKKNVSLIRKYSNDIDWFTYTKRYRNNRVIEVLKYDLREKSLEISDELKRGYQLKELFLDIINHAAYANCKEQLLAWIELCRESKIEEFIEASNTIDNWLENICNSFINRILSNGYTEGLNNKIKVIKRVGFGYKDFDFFRLRILYILNGKIHGNSKKDGFQKNEKIKKSRN